MKIAILAAAATTAVAFTGCVTAPANVPDSVGPAPYSKPNGAVDGTLLVYSQTEEQNDVGFEFPYPARTSYYIYDSSGKEVKHIIDNNRGHFDDTPRAVALPPGDYKVKALVAHGPQGEWVMLPVVVAAGRTTEAHLNRPWQPPADATAGELADTPWGTPIGWRAGAPGP